MQVTVLVSGSQPEYASVADALLAFAGAERVRRIDLQGDVAVARDAVAALRAEGEHSVLAVGLLAARSAHSLISSDVVFSQVFNHFDYKLLGENAVGIDALPSIFDAVASWRSVQPKLRRIGVITGPGHEHRIHWTADSLRPLGIELQHVVSSSDKETAIAFNKMVGSIDGYWLLPDNRVLSRETLRDLMSNARRAGVGVLVHDQGLLEYGGLLCALADPKEIAEAAYDQLLAARDLGEFARPGVKLLKRSAVLFDANTARQLGLNVDSLPQTMLAR